MATEQLQSAPGLLQPYLKAALGALPLPTGSRPRELPERQVVLDGLTVDREHLARYAEVCGFRNADVLPPTYLHVLAFGMSMRLMSAGDFPFELLGLVHVANRIEVARPATADETFDVRVHAADLRPHRSGTQVDLVTEIDVAGERVWTGTSTYLRRHRVDRPAGDSRPAAPEPVEEPTATATWRLDEGLGRRYAAVSGDRNPIHLHALSAKAFGFPRAIAHGMWTAARAVAALEGRLPDAFDYTVEFRKPVLLPGTAELATHRRGGGWELDLRDPRKGASHLHGEVTAR
ncbi:MaoC/PaaZ C-terminal domain-containing protein [Rhodococcus aerolatus]